MVRLESAGLLCFYSPVEALAGNAEAAKRDALDFHRVNRALFQQGAIIPFRFPTLLPSPAHVDAYLREHAPPYHAALLKIADKVQMEIRLRTEGEAGATAAGSGREYLQARVRRARRLEQALAAVRVAIHREVIDWRQRETARGVRCFVLVRRQAVDDFQQGMRRVALGSGVGAAVSGPWPPTEFLPDLS